MERDTLLYQQLHKLSAIESEEDFQSILLTLWRTRKTGLSDADKSYVRSLVNLPSLSELDPVLACLRSIIRKCTRENLASDDILKLFPPDLPLDLQSILLMLLQKHQCQWKEEMLKDQHQLPRIGFPHHVHAGLPPSFSSFHSPGTTPSLWPRQDDPVAHLNGNNLGAAATIVAETNVTQLAPLSLQIDPPDNLGLLPRLKSMTWTLENRSKAPTNKVAVISLKLQDYTKSPSGEIDVKFQLNRDTLEAMLKSMTYISEQLSNLVGSSLEPLQKKPRQ